ncbi:hypothetical protein BOTBODRAFT_46258 [Botryobasidium botryosum FD-172 SS1]|uniref:Uncharacterized protein n=1 Tax=Botryobasidium botryosum (strain FD-172 SS1) TaxID=930990 RepID=A0A067MIF1_BOTB1|nr:hypothetical protein BOTBODRAFT_46258 [Botryobasidium botryosum FD-172 SS1]
MKGCPAIPPERVAEAGLFHGTAGAQLEVRGGEVKGDIPIFQGGANQTQSGGRVVEAVSGPQGVDMRLKVVTEALEACRQAFAEIFGRRLAKQTWGKKERYPRHRSREVACSERLSEARGAATSRNHETPDVCAVDGEITYGRARDEVQDPSIRWKVLWRKWRQNTKCKAAVLILLGPVAEKRLVAKDGILVQCRHGCYLMSMEKEFASSAPLSCHHVYLQQKSKIISRAFTVLHIAAGLDKRMEYYTTSPMLIWAGMLVARERRLKPVDDGFDPSKIGRPYIHIPGRAPALAHNDDLTPPGVSLEGKVLVVPISLEEEELEVVLLASGIEGGYGAVVNLPLPLQTEGLFYGGKRRSRPGRDLNNIDDMGSGQGEAV